MTCTIFYTTEMPNQQAKVSGTPPRKPMRWAVEYLVKTPDGRTLVESTKTIQRATFEELRAIWDHTIGAIGDEAGTSPASLAGEPPPAAAAVSGEHGDEPASNRHPHQAARSVPPGGAG